MNKIISRKWHLIDAENKVIGKVAEKAAVLLRGKGKVDFTYNEDKGDYVVIINVAKVAFAGRKIESKIHRHHSGYMGGLKEIPMADYFERFPDKVMREAISGMMPRNKLRTPMMRRLHMFKNDNHSYKDKFIVKEVAK
ncbi:50S ribosomal protein L13 [bacterium]|nr:MAG: 50S ribosomal protein L13 [bacterium]